MITDTGSESVRGYKAGSSPTPRKIIKKLLNKKKTGSTLYIFCNKRIPPPRFLTVC